MLSILALYERARTQPEGPQNGVLDWKQSPADAVGTSAVFARTPAIIVEKTRMAPAMADALRQRGWNIVEDTLLSGTHVIQVTPKGLIGGADPRLEGKAVALPAPP